MSELKPINKHALIFIKAHREELTWNEYKALRELVLEGRDKAAMKWLRRILKKKQRNEQK